MGLKTPPGAVITLFELDLTDRGEGILRFHAGTNELRQPVVWQGNVYQPFPIEAEGFDRMGDGAVPRPTFRVANVNQLVGQLARDYNDLVGATVRRRRTFARFLDAVNFEGGVNPEANPAMEIGVDEYQIERKVVENKVLLEFELSMPLDRGDVMVPARPALRLCVWRYKGEECGYDGALPTCDKGLATANGCAAHFGQGAELPFGGFPGTGRQLS